jgi:N-acetylmuramoyl-L-alanine amidase
MKNNGPLVKRLRESASGQKGTYRLVVDLNQPSQATVFTLQPEKPYGHRLVLDLPHQQANAQAVTESKKVTATPAAGRDIIIAIDAGHGGEDPGALGRYTYEKKVTLEIAKRLQKRVNQQKGMRAFLIRTGDYFINLNKRSAIARKQKADFLVSIHADGFTSSQPRGASVWVLSNRRATTELGRWMEKHEAHSELLGGAGNLIQDSSSVPFLTEMFLDMSMGNAMDVGYHAGDLVVKELKKVTKLHKKQPVHASLAVLKSPDIPSILVEAGFITNRTEERLLNQASHQNKIANAVFTGIYKHFQESPPQHTLFAQKKRAIKHTVRSGESLSLLAARYSVSTQELVSYNRLKSTSLRIGQVIKIPPHYQLAVKAEPVVEIAAKPQKEQTHRVKRGESLSVIAQRYGKTVKELKSYNKLRSTSLAIGQKVKIPGGAVVQQAKVEPVVVKAVVHQVKRGESLSVIAQRYGKSTRELKDYNKLRSTTLAIGQQIKIPGRVVALQPKAVPVVAKATVHKVQRGESLSVIAQHYGKTTQELKSYNKLRSTTLAIGQKIKIPGRAVVQQPRAVPVVAKAAVHKVQRGESLSVIAQHYGKTTQELKSYNKLRSTTLAIGQQIKIPGRVVAQQAKPVVVHQPKVAPVVAKPVVHQVKRGESLSVIAQRYGKTVKELKAYNHLASTSLRVAQRLKIPAGDDNKATAPVKAKPFIYKVKKGESLSVIASRFGTTVNALKKHNNLGSSSLWVGQKIKVPASLPRVTKHKVRSGESLSVIANRYGTTTHVLKAFNKLSSNSLMIGQVLTIPVT